MAHTIGTKGQVVIEKAIRDRLGVGPGWNAVQRLVDDHVEFRFIPPTHNRSLAGCLRHLIDPAVRTPTDEDMDAAVAAGMVADWRSKEERIRAQEATESGERP